MMNLKQPENVEYFNYLGSKILNDARGKRGISFAMAKAACSKKKALFTSKVDLNLRKKLIQCYVWSIALCCAVILTLQTTDQIYLENFEM